MEPGKYQLLIEKHTITKLYLLFELTTDEDNKLLTENINKEYKKTPPNRLCMLLIPKQKLSRKI